MTVAFLARSSWLKQIEDPSLPPGILAWDLGAGESAVITWALAHPGVRAIMDDLAMGGSNNGTGRDELSYLVESKRGFHIIWRKK